MSYLDDVLYATLQEKEHELAVLEDRLSEKSVQFYEAEKEFYQAQRFYDQCKAELEELEAHFE
jgi:hypothetical protein